MENHIVDYNKDENLLIISSSNISPLKVEYNGAIELQINGQFNLSTVNNSINIDSFNSKIFLNSTIKDSIINKEPKNIENTEITLKYTSEVNNLISSLLTKISELETRIKNLENKKNINEIKFR